VCVMDPRLKTIVRYNMEDIISVLDIATVRVRLYSEHVLNDREYMELWRLPLSEQTEHFW
jgi:hypothetical protein